MRKLLFPFFLFLIALYVLYRYVHLPLETYDEFISPLADSAKENLPFLSQKTPIEQAVISVLSKREGMYAVYYKDLKSGEVYEKDSHQMFQSASLYKLWIMAEVFDQINKGKLKKEEVMKQAIPTLNAEFHIASEDAELTDGDVQASVDDALENMITVSNNYAALLLSEKLGLANVSMFLKTNGFLESSIGSPPMTTASDIGLFFEKLYNGKIVGSQYKREVLAILERQQINDRLPKYLPESIAIAHKTGELSGFKHDAGIVYAPSGPYIVVILSKSSDEAYAAETIALISAEIYRTREKN